MAERRRLVGWVLMEDGLSGQGARESSILCLHSFIHTAASQTWKYKGEIRGTGGRGGGGGLLSELEGRATQSHSNAYVGG